MWIRYLIASSIILYLFIQTFSKYNLKQLGFFKPTKWDYFYFVLTPFLILVPFLVFRLPNFCPPEPLGFPKTTPVLLLLFVYGLVNAVGQELIYRSFLINHLEETFNDKKLVLILGAVLFSLLHVAWGAYFVLGALIVGIYLVWWFMNTRNIVLITLLHIPMSMLAIYICFI